MNRLHLRALIIPCAGPLPPSAALAASPTVKISGRLEYQACDDKVCYAPTKVPFSFALDVKDK